MMTLNFANILTDIEQGTFKEEYLDFLGEDIDDEKAIKLAQALMYNPYIKRINLSNKNIGDEGAKALAAVKTIQELDLSNGLSGYDEYENHITAIGVQALANSNLKKLLLNGNPIGNKGIKLLAKNKTIIDLEVSDCDITNEGAAELFSINTAIQNLNLRANNIDDNSLIAICLNKTLLYLDLSCCQITNHGLELLAQNNCIKNINLNDNKITNEGIKVLIKKNSSIEYLSVNGCEVYYDESLKITLKDNIALKEMCMSYDKYKKFDAMQQDLKRKIEDGVNEQENKYPKFSISG